MKKNIRSIIAILSIAILGIIFTGCMASMASMYGVKSSKYTPIVMSKNDYENHLKLVKQNQDKIVTDKLGTYFFKFYNNDKELGTFTLPKEYDYAKKILVSGVGVMEPIYYINSNSKLIYDSKATTAFYRKLKKSFNLLPLSATRKYHKNLLKHIAKIVELDNEQLKNALFPKTTPRFTDNIMATKKTVNRAMSGEANIINSIYYKDVLSTLPKHDFVIRTSSAVISSYRMMISDEQKRAIWHLQDIKSLALAKKLENSSDSRERGHAKGLYKSIANKSVKRVESEASKFAKFKEALSGGISVEIYPTKSLKDMKVAGFYNTMISMSYVNIAEKKKTWSKKDNRQSPMSMAFSATADGMLGTFKNQKDLYDKKMKTALSKYNKALKDYTNFINHNYKKSRAKYQNGYFIYLKDLKLKLKLVTGVKSHKLD